jgi:hypothetical protein
VDETSLTPPKTRSVGADTNAPKPKNDLVAANQNRAPKPPKVRGKPQSVRARMKRDVMGKRVDDPAVRQELESMGYTVYERDGATIVSRPRGHSEADFPKVRVLDGEVRFGGKSNRAAVNKNVVGKNINDPAVRAELESLGYVVPKRNGGFGTPRRSRSAMPGEQVKLTVGEDGTVQLAKPAGGAKPKVVDLTGRVPDDGAEFRPQGLDYDPSNPAHARVGKQMEGSLESYQKHNGWDADGQSATKDLFRTGDTIPRAADLKPGDEVFKLVPSGQEPSPHTQFWMSKAEYEAFVANPNDVAARYGLPYQSTASKYTAFKMSVKPANENAVPPTAANQNRPGTRVYDSRVAPTEEGGVVRPGGGEQRLVTDRRPFTKPQKVDEHYDAVTAQKQEGLPPANTQNLQRQFVGKDISDPMVRKRLEWAGYTVYRRLGEWQIARPRNADPVHYAQIHVDGNGQVAMGASPRRIPILDGILNTDRRTGHDQTRGTGRVNSTVRIRPAGPGGKQVSPNAVDEVGTEPGVDPGGDVGVETGIDPGDLAIQEHDTGEING